MTDRNEALRLADLFELEPDPESLYRKAAAILRQQAERIAELEAERDRLREEVETLKDSVAAKAERIDRLGGIVEELSADALRFRSIDWHWEPERDMGRGGRWWASIWVKETPRKNTAVAAIDAARTTHKETE